MAFSLQDKDRKRKQNSAIKRKAREAKAKKKQLSEVEVAEKIGTPVAYGYGRVSDRSQEDTDSVPAQEKRVTSYFNFALKDEGVAWGGFYAEPESVSAYKKGFMSRPVGKQIIRIIKPNDHLIIDKVDRIWRNVNDYATVLQFFKSQKITLHFVDLNGCTVVLGTPMGDFMLTLMVAVAQLESAQTAARNRACIAYARERGFYSGNIRSCPMGCIVKKKRVSHEGKKQYRNYLVYDMEQRSLMQEIVRVIDEEGMGLRAAGNHIEHMLMKAHNQEGPAPKAEERSWHSDKVKRAYLLEKHYRIIPNPNWIKFTEVRNLNFTEVRKYGLTNPCVWKVSE